MVLRESLAMLAATHGTRRAQPLTRARRLVCLSVRPSAAVCLSVCVLSLPLSLQVYHSTMLNVQTQTACGSAILPLKTKVKGPAPPAKTSQNAHTASAQQQRSTGRLERRRAGGGRE